MSGYCFHLKIMLFDKFIAFYVNLSCINKDSGAFNVIYVQFNG